MGERSTIEWTDATWNPWSGCTKVSPGCQKCYAERIVERRGRDFSQIVRSKSTFNDPLRWKEPRMIFTCSMSDFFHEAADSWRPEAWEIIRRSPYHVFQVLTKRPERIADHLPKDCFQCGNTENDHPSIVADVLTNGKFLFHKFEGWPWPNVWLGTSVEMQLYADKRIHFLTEIPAEVHFLSCEPLLGPIDLESNHSFPDIDWVITGGESDYSEPRLSPDLPLWFLSIRDQCEQAGVAYFHKQNGGTQKCECHGAWGCRLLDGRTYDAMPE